MVGLGGLTGQDVILDPQSSIKFDLPANAPVALLSAILPIELLRRVQPAIILRGE